MQPIKLFESYLFLRVRSDFDWVPWYGSYILPILLRRTTMLEEVTDSNIRMEPLHYPVVALVEQQLAPKREVSADRQICVAEGASEKSIGQIDPKTPGWTRR